MQTSSSIGLMSPTCHGIACANVNLDGHVNLRTNYLQPCQCPPFWAASALPTLFLMLQAGLRVVYASSGSTANLIAE